jgi:hypothetical protein
MVCWSITFIQFVALNKYSSQHYCLPEYLCGPLVGDDNMGRVSNWVASSLHVKKFNLLRFYFTAKEILQPLANWHSVFMSLRPPEKRFKGEVE